MRTPRIGPALLLAAAIAAPLAVPAHASDSLATPITTELAESMWPVEVTIEIRDVSGNDGTVLPRKRVVVPDGHRLSWASAVWTPRGQRFFELDLVARQHPRDEIELEWDVVVSRAPVLPMDVAQYVLYRLQLGEKPRLGEKRLEAARSDIVSTMGGVFSEKLQIEGQTYEIRILAQSQRG